MRHSKSRLWRTACAWVALALGITESHGQWSYDSGYNMNEHIAAAPQSSSTNGAQNLGSVPAGSAIPLFLSAGTEGGQVWSYIAHVQVYDARGWVGVYDGGFTGWPDWSGNVTLYAPSTPGSYSMGFACYDGRGVWSPTLWINYTVVSSSGSLVAPPSLSWNVPTGNVALNSTQYTSATATFQTSNNSDGNNWNSPNYAHSIYRIMVQLKKPDGSIVQLNDWLPGAPVSSPASTGNLGFVCDQVGQYYIRFDSMDTRPWYPYGGSYSGWQTSVYALNPTPVITSATTASGTYNSAVSYQITATNSPTSYGASGLPPGLSVNSGSGVISGTPTAAGTYVSTITASNASSTGSASLTWTINKATPATPSNTPSANPITYGGSVTFTPAGSTTGRYQWLINGSVVSTNTGSWSATSGSYTGGTWSISGINLVCTPSSATSFTTGFQDIGNSNYNASAVATVSMTVNKATAATPTVSPSANPVAYSSSVTFTPGNGTTNNYAWILNGATISTYNGASWSAASGSYAGGTWAISGLALVATPSSVTNFTVAFQDTGNSNYNAATSGTLTESVIKGNQTISFANPGTQTFGTPLNLVGSASSGLGVAWSVTSGPASLSGSTLTFTGTGAVTVAANQAGNANWNAAPQVSQTFTVSPKPVTFSLSAASFTYTGASLGPTVVASDAAATFSTGGTLTATAVGSYTATAAASGNYTGSNSSLTWSISKAAQSSVTISPTSGTYTVGRTISFTGSGGNGTGALAWSGSAGTSGVTGSASTVSATLTATGTQTVSVYRATDPNYSQSNTATANLTVIGAPSSTPSVTGGSTLFYGQTLTTRWQASSSTNNLSYAMFRIGDPAAVRKTSTLAPTGTDSGAWGIGGYWNGGGPFDVTTTFVPLSIGTFSIWLHARNPDWDGTSANSNGDATTTIANAFTIAKATPTASFASKSANPSGLGYTVQAADLNASFANPYNTTDTAAPSGAITYSVAPGSPSGTVGSSVAAGTSLSAGSTFLIRATFPGDSRYNSATKDATFTIGSLGTLVIDGLTAGTLNLGSAYRDAAAGSPNTTTATLTIRNSGQGTATVSSIAITGAQSSSFSLVSPPSFPLTLAGGATQSITVKFTPNGAGPNSATLTVNADTVTATATLSGTSLASSVSITWQ